MRFRAVATVANRVATTKKESKYQTKMKEQKEKGLSRANGNSPQTVICRCTNKIITQNQEKINTEPLRDLRLSRNISTGDMVQTVRALYPKYDRYLKSRCEHSAEYGVVIRPKAIEALLEKFAPDLLEAERKRRNSFHRLKRRIACRLADEEHEALLRYMKDEGFDTTQARLSFHVKHYLKSKRNAKEGGTFLC